VAAGHPGDALGVEIPVVVVSGSDQPFPAGKLTLAVKN
jgi:hypothetical protein